MYYELTQKNGILKCIRVVLVEERTKCSQTINYGQTFFFLPLTREHDLKLHSSTLTMDNVQHSCIVHFPVRTLSFLLYASFKSTTSNSLQPGSSPLGLSAEGARSGFERHGPNICATERPPSAIVLLFTAFSNPFNFILIALAIVSIATGDKATFTVMWVMVIASTSLRFVSLFNCDVSRKEKQLSLSGIGFGKNRNR